ncbi:acyl-CoA thioesterase [Sphingopyxis panaciterrulae]|uniref:Acyl-CoA thioesterase YciA n=1 Tax=Sphingopyxis panaciterrulae TaxID=462372 RepID=A0A7W9B570_9SPHN|nr:acyl-CoA thioesterase [Sphingopyxis panaciterrulae]MBB5706465.1 acyl-CoA thioesterase YciA [Sphingopyxis panaciterrulae]
MPNEVMPACQPAVRVTAMPANANVYGDIFGGWLMAQMDLAASSVASLHARGRAVTISVEGMTFHRPVFVGDELSVFGRLIKVGRTSMHVEVETWGRDRHSDEGHKVTQAVFIFVAVGPDRRPRTVPPIES